MQNGLDTARPSASHGRAARSGAKVTLVPVEYEGVRYVCENMRERDRAEIYATRWDDSPDLLAVEIMSLQDFAWMTLKGGEPVAIIGATPVWPTVWNIFAFGTERWPETIIALTRHVFGFIKPALIRAGCRRAQCHALKEHDDARKWLGLLGIHAEREMPDFGKNGETFVAYRWLLAEEA